MLTIEMLCSAAGRPPNANMQSILSALQVLGDAAGLVSPHRLAHFIAQAGHETAWFYYDREVWGPTAAQRRYEDRVDLGHSPAAPGEAARFKGRGPFQLTGRHNYRQFTEWAKQNDPSAPDFEANPDLVLTDPWEGASAIWYWQDRGLNDYADRNDFMNLTRRINGGLNGLADRELCYGRIALTILGRSPTHLRTYQSECGLTADGICGPRTRAALHEALLTLDAPLPTEAQ